MPNAFPSFTAAGLDAVRAGADRPLLLTNATVHTLDPLSGPMHGADGLIGATLSVRCAIWRRIGSPIQPLRRL